MSSDLRAALEALHRQREVKLKEVAKIESAIENMKEIIGLVDGPQEPESQEYAGMSIGDAAALVIADQPRTTREIAEALLNRGVKTTSKNFTMTVYTVLRESKRFRRTNAATWELAPVAPAPPKPAPVPMPAGKTRR